MRDDHSTSTHSVFWLVVRRADRIMHMHRVGEALQVQGGGISHAKMGEFEISIKKHGTNVAAPIHKS